MSKTKDYVKNTIILLLGKFTTQFMTFLLLPLYTKRLDTADYGAVDLIQTYITLLLPVLTLRLDSATFRFLVDKRKNQNEIKKCISNILIILFVVIAISLIIGLIIPIFINIKYYPFILSNLIALMLSNIFLQFLRGLGKNKEYSIASIIAGVSTLAVNLILILGFNCGAESILISSTIANVFCLIFVAFSIKLHKNISFKLFDKKTVKEYLKYSIPMIPNALSWWVVNASDRTLIRIFLGAAFNGIYTVSCKFSNILNSIFSIFSMSWQESASLHINDKDRDEYFTKMINQILMFFSAIALAILVILPVFYTIIVGEDYWDSYTYIPVLLYANTWHTLIGLIGGIYVAKKQTKEIASTTIISAIINIVIDLVLIHFIGLHAATISTLIAYMSMALYRAKDCQKYVKYKMDVKNIIIYSFVFAISTVIYLTNCPILNILNIIFAAIYIYLVNKNSIKTIQRILMRKLRRE